MVTVHLSRLIYLDTPWLAVLGLQTNLSGREKRRFMNETSLDSISVAISTVKRKKNYIYKVVSSLPKDMPLRLLVGSPMYDHLERYRDDPRIEIIGVDPAQWHEYKDYTVKRRSSWNYWRCFTYGINPDRPKGLLILEDDVIPAKGWQERLSETIERIEQEYGDEYVLTLYTAYKELSKPAVAGGGYYRRYPAEEYEGAQAMYYPESVRAVLAEYFKKEGVETWRTPYDWLLGEYLTMTGIPLFISTPCLFQHIGDISSVFSPGFHRAKHFGKVNVKGKSKSGRLKNK